MSHFPVSLSFDKSKLPAVSRKWKIAELSLFGSALRDDFEPDSDVDLVVKFEPDSDSNLA